MAVPIARSVQTVVGWRRRAERAVCECAVEVMGQWRAGRSGSDGHARRAGGQCEHVINRLLKHESLGGRLKIVAMSHGTDTLVKGDDDGGARA